MSFTIHDTPSNIVLRSPDWGNVERMDANNIHRFSRAGDILVYDDAAWARIFVRKYNFSLIQLAVINALRTFLKVNAGLEITITDHLGDEYDGYIITPVNEIIAVRPDCSYNVSFEFMEVP